MFITVTLIVGGSLWAWAVMYYLSTCDRVNPER